MSLLHFCTISHSFQFLAYLSHRTESMPTSQKKMRAEERVRKQNLSQVKQTRRIKKWKVFLMTHRDCIKSSNTFGVEQAAVYEIQYIKDACKNNIFAFDRKKSSVKPVKYIPHLHIVSLSIM